MCSTLDSELKGRIELSPSFARYDGCHGRLIKDKQ